MPWIAELEVDRGDNIASTGAIGDDFVDIVAAVSFVCNGPNTDAIFVGPGWSSMNAFDFEEPFSEVMIAGYCIVILIASAGSAFVVGWFKLVVLLI